MLQTDRAANCLGLARIEYILNQEGSRIWDENTDIPHTQDGQGNLASLSAGSLGLSKENNAWK